MSISSPGIGSGLDINGIVSKLMTVESQPLTTLATKEASYQAKLSAYGSLGGALSSFQSAIQALNDPTKFQSLTASSSDTTVATATAGPTAVAGSYALNVSQVAQSQQLVAAGQSSTAAAIGLGTSTTLTFDFGTISGGALTAYNSTTGTGGTYSSSTFTSNGNGTKTVTIDATNNSLSGIRDAINNANIGVKATIINDGGASPYRLVLTSANMGQNNSIKISASAGGDATLSAFLSQDPAAVQNLQQTVAAQNTQMTVNGVFVSKASNTITDVIPGVTLTALKVGTSTVSATQDTSGVTSAVNGFIKGYNDLNKTIKSLSSYDATTKVAGVLLGDASLRNVQSQIRTLLGTTLVASGAYTTLAYTNLTQVGIMLQKDGTLQLDAGKLQSALASNPTDVAALFTTTGKTSDSLVTYAGSTSSTQPGTYALNVTQLATQGTLTGSAAAGLSIISGSNDTLAVTVNGVSASVTLAPSLLYTPATLAAEVQSKINGASALSNAGISVSVTMSAGGVMTLTSNLYGSASSVSVGGNAMTNLLGLTPASTLGVDVAGTFGGVAGSGSGQNLTGTSSSGANGLKLLINGGATGSRGTVSFSQGFAYKLDKLMTSLLGSTGPIASATVGTNKSIKDIGTQRDALNLRLAATQKRYLAQFNAMDALVSKMNSTSTFLTQQLATMASQTKLN
jgi:flagellar hook-associated protein 2